MTPTLLFYLYGERAQTGTFWRGVLGLARLDLFSFLFYLCPDWEQHCSETLGDYVALSSTRVAFGGATLAFISTFFFFCFLFFGFWSADRFISDSISRYRYTSPHSIQATEHGMGWPWAREGGWGKGVGKVIGRRSLFFLFFCGLTKAEEIDALWI